MEKCTSDLRTYGRAVMRGVIPQEDVAAMRESIAATVRSHTTKAMPQGYVGSLLRVNQDIAEYVAHPRIMRLCESLFGPHTRISAITGTINAPGVARGELHVDWPHNSKDESCIHSQLGDVLAHLVTFWMLTDFTAKNGATIVVPGSHRWPAGTRIADEISAEEEQLLGSAGDVGLLDARTWHAIAPNLSGDDRVAVIVRYAPWWLNLNPLRRGSRDRQVMVDSRQGRDPYVVPLTESRLRSLPANVQPLLEAMVENDGDRSGARQDEGA